MKILYISNIGLPPTFPHEDYLNDCVFHGFRTLFGSDCVDVAKNESMYKGATDGNRDKMYGKGFTLYGLLDDISVDRTDIESKIKHKNFDFVIYGQVTRSRPYIQLVNEHYPRKKIIMLDGEDETHFNTQYRDMSVFFKRELNVPDEKIHPISFCIPSDLLIKKCPTKTQMFAGTPTNKHVYITEAPYYEEYQRSYFGITHKKAGWDCLRHYEILMNRCIPYFRDIYQLPERTMTHFPIDLVKRGMKLINQEKPDDELYGIIDNHLYTHMVKNLTTTAMANYVIRTAWRQ